MKYIGVTRLSTGKWKASIYLKDIRKVLNLGHYATALDAAIAYNQQAPQYRPDALLNKNIIDTVKVTPYHRHRWYE